MRTMDNLNINEMTLEELNELLAAVEAKIKEIEGEPEQAEDCDEDKEKREGEETEEVVVDQELLAALPDALEALEEIVDQVGERKAALLKKSAQRKSLIDKIAAGKVGTEVRKAPGMNIKEERKMNFGRETKEYRDAWLCAMAGRPLTAEQRSAMDSQTSSGGYAIPEQVANKIIANMVKIAPMIGEIDLMHVAGNLTLLVEGTVNAASIHTEAASITPASDTIIRIQLSGYEIVKVIGISAKLDAMSVDALEGWIVDNISRKLAETIEDYIINGDGSGEPHGIDSITWDTTTYTDCVDWASTAPTAAELITLIGKLNGAYAAGAKFLMNWKTFWTEVFALRDDKNEPVVRQEGENKYVFGFPVIISDKCVDDDIFFGNYFEGVKGNFAQDIEIESDASSGFLTNTKNYRGRCLFDCNVVTGRIVKGSANP